MFTELWSESLLEESLKRPTRWKGDIKMDLRVMGYVWEVD
jgi:hypothetical protein